MWLLAIRETGCRALRTSNRPLAATRLGSKKKRLAPCGPWVAGWWRWGLLEAVAEQAVGVGVDVENEPQPSAPPCVTLGSHSVDLRHDLFFGHWRHVGHVQVVCNLQ